MVPSTCSRTQWVASMAEAEAEAEVAEVAEAAEAAEVAEVVESARAGDEGGDGATIGGGGVAAVTGCSLLGRVPPQAVSVIDVKMQRV